MARSKYERTQNIRQAMSGLTFSDVANAIGVSEFTLRKWIARDLSNETYYKIMRAIEEVRENL